MQRRGVIKIAYELTKWIFDDSIKADAAYRGILAEPYSKYGDVAGQLEELRKKGLAKGDKRIDSYLKKVDVFSQTEPFDVSGTIDENNDTWKGGLQSNIDKAKDKDELGAVKQTFDAQKGKYEEESSNEIAEAITKKESELEKPKAPPEELLKPRQVENIGDILGLPEEAVRDFGIRQIQFQLEEQLRERIDTATTSAELDEVAEDLDIMPTKAGIIRLRGDINAKRGELEGE